MDSGQIIQNKHEYAHYYKPQANHYPKAFSAFVIFR